jgi:hypothetical protein
LQGLSISRPLDWEGVRLSVFWSLGRHGHRSRA